MRPFLCYLGLWHWAQAATALTITSISNTGNGVEAGKVVTLRWDKAVGTVNASLVSVEKSGDATSKYLLSGMLTFRFNSVTFTDYD